MSYHSCAFQAFQKNKPPTPFDWTKESIFKGPDHVRPKAFFDMKMGDETLGRLVFELADDILPQTCANFIALCENRNSENDSGKNKDKRKYSYQGTKIHQVYKDVFIMGGDVVKNDGTQSHSAGKHRYFPDENFIIPHSARGLLSMASIGVDTNGSQFYISLKPTSYMDGRCMVFGRLVEGENVIKSIESTFTFRGKPTTDIVIADSGLLK